MKSTFVIGSRGSKLALWQANFVKAQLSAHFPQTKIEIEIIKTSGDVMQNVSLAEIGGKGVFTKELETALLLDRIDLAVHSLKDLPTTLPEKLCIAAVLPREDVRDALIVCENLNAVSIRDLPQNAVVGTSSIRRAAQLKNVRKDLEIKDLRGNVDTRLRKLEELDYDAIILAAAGLKRLGFDDKITAFLSENEMLPQIGQGALAIETRNDDAATNEFIKMLHDEKTFAEISAERAFLRGLGGGCQFPIAAHAVVKDNGELHLRGLVATPDGSLILRDEHFGNIENAENIGRELSQKLFSNGAEKIISNFKFQTPIHQS